MTLELAGLASCRINTKAKRQSMKTAFNYVGTDQLFFAGLIFVQRAFCAAAILARVAALTLRFFFTGSAVVVLATGAGVPRIAVNPFSSLAIFSLRPAALRS